MKETYKRDVWKRIIQFYFDAISEHPNTYTVRDAFKDAQNAYYDREFYQTEETTPQWETNNYSVVRNKSGWYFAFKIENETTFYYECENYRNMKKQIAYPIPQKKQLEIPPTVRILKKQYYGLYVGYWNGKYILLDNNGKPKCSTWLNKAKFFNKPTKPNSIIAHVSVNGQLWAMDRNCNFQNLNRTWDSLYANKNESIKYKISQIISETIHAFILKNCICIQNKKCI